MAGSNYQWEDLADDTLSLLTHCSRSLFLGGSSTHGVVRVLILDGCGSDFFHCSQLHFDVCLDLFDENLMVDGRSPRFWGNLSCIPRGRTSCSFVFSVPGLSRCCSVLK